MLEAMAYLQLLAIAILVGKIVLTQKDRDARHRLSVHLNSIVLIMGLCLIGLI